MDELNLNTEETSDNTTIDDIPEEDVSSEVSQDPMTALESMVSEAEVKIEEISQIASTAEENSDLGADAAGVNSVLNDAKNLLDSLQEQMDIAITATEKEDFDAVAEAAIEGKKLLEQIEALVDIATAKAVTSKPSQEEIDQALSEAPPPPPTPSLKLWAKRSMVA